MNPATRSVARRGRYCGHQLGASAGEALAARPYADNSAERAGLDIAVANAPMTSMAASGF